MDDKVVSGSSVVPPEENIDSLYPMFFGVSCAFFALKLLPEPEMCDDDKWSEIKNRMLKGSAHLLGLFIWRVQREGVKSGRVELLQKLENAEKQIEELKKRRSDEAKANEKVVSIVASREQSWFDERRRLKQHIEGLTKELRVIETKKERIVAELNEKLKEGEALQSDKVIEDGVQRRRETEERVKKAENLVDELGETVRREAQRHSNEILKHKTEFIEIMANQRQLEEENGGALRQAEAAKQDLDSALKQKEQSVMIAQRPSMELVKAREDLEQKDQILSAMLRKSKLDAAEKQKLLTEMKSPKAKRKQAELETARWKAFSEPKHGRHSLRNLLSRHVNVKLDAFSGGKRMHSKATMSMNADCHHESEQPEDRNGTNEPHLMSEAELLKKEVKAETEMYEIKVEQRHNLEIDAFVGQLRLQDEKLGASRWRLLSTELELKRLQSLVEGLDHEITRLRQENMKLETLLLDRDTELSSLKEQSVLQVDPPTLQKLNFNISTRDAAMNHDTVWSKVKVIKRKQGQKRQEMKATAEETSQAVEHEKEDEIQANEQAMEKATTLQYPRKEVKEGEVAASGPRHFRHEIIESSDQVSAETSTSVGQGSRNRSSLMWKMEIHALGVSYKIKRLKQQFLMLERLAGKQESSENSKNNSGHSGQKEFYALTSLLKKQVDRYESLQRKTDDICQRMHDSNLNLNRGVSVSARAEDETTKLEHFLEETFQLQRYIVATGQKSMEVQAKITSGFVGDAEEFKRPENFDMKQFADSIRMLFHEVQRGLEVRISQIIGDLEGTLACDSITHLKK